VSSGGLEAPPPAPPPELDHWHVAINDVPVGPIRREEIARKISTGAVNKDSLCWREGFDDWRPLREVPELSALLRRPAPPPSRPAPVGRGIGARSSGGSRPRIRPIAPRTSSSSAIPGRPGGAEARPAARSNVVPIGGRLGAAAAPAFEEPRDLPHLDEVADDPARLSDPLLFTDAVEAGSAGASPQAGGMFPPSASLGSIPQAPAPSASQLPGAPGFDAAAGAAAGYAPPARRRGLPVGAWIAIAGAMAFGVMLALMVGSKLLLDQQPAPVADASGAGEGAETAGPVEPELVTDVPEPEIGAEAIEEAGGAEVEPEVAAGGTTMRTAPRVGSGSGGTKTKQLTAAEQEMLRRMGQDTESGPSKIRVGSGPSAAGGNGSGRGLTQQQLSSVVSRNRPSLQRCYETAIRGMGEPPSVRLDVDVTVGLSGTVTRVSARGRDVGGLRACVEAAVRRWRFPISGAASAVAFPVVFTAGS